MVQKFDAIVIGTGQSGSPIARRFAHEGKSVAIIEQAHFGGSCVNYGCTPTKALVANAKIVHSVRISKTFGVNVDKFQIDYKAIKARKDAMVKESTDAVKNSLLEAKGCRIFQGHASFEGQHQVEVGDQHLEGDKIFIDVGTRARIPEIPGLDKVPYLTNASLLDLEILPEHLLILGGGYVGLEFAQIFRRFGSRVTVIQQSPYIMTKEDLEVSKAIQEFLGKEGIEIYTNARNFEILPDSKDGKINAQIDQNGTKLKISGSHLLIAAGRLPNTDDLGLEKAGVNVDKKGFIIVDDTLRTSQPHIWAVGDCNGRGAFTHTSYNDFEIVTENLFDNGTRKVSDRILIYALFTDPPLARVGMNEKQALEKYENVLSAKIPMTEVGRAWEKSETEGFLKILVDGKSKQILGASFLGTSCDEVIHVIAEAMYAKVPYTFLNKVIYIHPTVSEFIPDLLSELKPLKQLAGARQ